MTTQESTIASLIGIELPVTGDDVASRLASLKQLTEGKNPGLVGSNEQERIQIDQWLSFTRSEAITAEKLATLNSFLASRTYLVGQRITLADYNVFASVPFELLSESTPHVNRWFDHIQHRCAGVELKQFSFKPVAIPSFVATPDPSSSPAPAPAPAAAAEAAPAPAAKAAPAPAPKAAPAAAKPAAAAAPAESKEDLDPSKLDIRVGLVVKCWNHEGSDKLLCEEIDLGEGSTRQIASGIRHFYSAEQVQGRKVLVLANLKERSIAGFKSQGMVLCASNADHTQVQLVEVPASAQVGERVLFDGVANGEAATPAQMVKKKIFEGLAPGLRTDAEGVARWQEAAFKVGGDLCRAPLPNAIVA